MHSIRKPRIMRILLTFCFLSFFLTTAQAQNTKHLPFQGKLYENGQPVSGVKTFSFNINDGGVNWTEVHPGVAITQGLYAVTLGANTPLPDNLFASTGMHELTVQVEGNLLDVVTIYAPVENDPTVQENVKDGVSWSEIEDLPPGIDTDITNELQELSVSGNTLSISDGNSVDLPGQENFGLPFEVGTSDTINQPIAATIGGNTSYINNSVWQSFLSSVNGRITSIQTVFNNISDVSITLKIYEGEGVATQFIESFTFSANEYPPLVSPVLQTFVLSSPVEIANGQKYTIEITGSGGGSSDLEFVTSGTSNPYSFGQSSIGPDTDLQFTINADIINEFSLVVSQTGNLDVPNGRITDKTGYLMPVGAILPFAGPKENVPEGFFFCEGQCLDKNVYPELFAAIGEYWGGCNDQTQFRLPDLRGAFLRGVSHESDKDPDKETRIRRYTNPVDTVGNQVGSFQESQLLEHEHEVIRETETTVFDDLVKKPIQGVRSNVDLNPYFINFGGPIGYSLRLGYLFQGNSDVVEIFAESTGGSESRPFNAYVNYIIKY